MITSKKPTKRKKNNNGEEIVYVDSKTDTVSCDGDMTSSIDGHPIVYMSFTSDRSRAQTKDHNMVQCDYCGRKFIRK